MGRVPARMRGMNLLRPKDLRRLGTLLLAGIFSGALAAQTLNEPSYAQAEPLGAALENWAYPYPVQMLQFEVEGRPLRMAYMDVRPQNPNGQTLVLMHGKNFGSDYWLPTLQAMSNFGFRVIAPDQIGFGKSSKPEMRYTFGMLAENTARLLDHLKLGRVTVVGNSMGGMLAVHFARRYPERVSALVLENPLGLEDYVSSIPPQQTSQLVRLEMAQTPASYRNFVRSYFPVWKPAYETFVEQFARVQLSGDYPRFALVSALTYQMIYEGPIINELPRLTVPRAGGRSVQTPFASSAAMPIDSPSVGCGWMVGRYRSRPPPSRSPARSRRSCRPRACPRCPAHDPMGLLVEDQLGEPLVAAIGDGSARRAHGKLALPTLRPCFAASSSVSPDPGDLRVGVGTLGITRASKKAFLAVAAASAATCPHAPPCARASAARRCRRSRRCAARSCASAMSTLMKPRSVTATPARSAPIFPPLGRAAHRTEHQIVVPALLAPLSPSN
jgi:pimeloyl-ACP methyl ester carboxylesterase